MVFIQLFIHSLWYTETKFRGAEGMLTEEEANFFQDFIKTMEVQKIRHALYGALLYSPLYLLTSKKLTSNAWDQERMLKVRSRTFFSIIVSFTYTPAFQVAWEH
jgi:hypothetical protein